MKQKDCYNTSKLAFHVFVKREKIPHVQFIRAYSESGGKTPLIKWSCEVRLRTQTFGFQKKKNLQYPLSMRLGGPKRRSGRFGEDKNLLLLIESYELLLLNLGYTVDM